MSVGGIGRICFRVPVVSCGPEQALALVRMCGTTAVIDVEPMLAHWNTSQEALDAGLRALLPTLPDIMIIFATNSSRRPGFALPMGRHYLNQAHKPFTRLPAAAGALFVGDQFLTDGLLAWRNRGVFVHTPLLKTAPFGVKIMWYAGRVLMTLFARRIVR